MQNSRISTCQFLLLTATSKLESSTLRQLIASAERCAHGTRLAAATAAAEEMVRVAVLTVGPGLLATLVLKGYSAMIVQRRAQTRNIAADTGTAEQMENAIATLHLVGLIVYPALMPSDWRVAM